MLKKLITAILIISSLSASAQLKTDKRLQSSITEILQGFNGDVGVYVKCLRTGKVAGVNMDTIFPTASMVKIPILIGMMDRIAKGQFSYDSVITYKDSLLYAGDDILGSFKTDEKIELSRVMMLMLTTSDNTASLWLQSLAGTGLRINHILDSLGFKSTRVNSRTPGREENRTIYGWGQTTPREMVMLFEKIYNKQIINEEYSQKMLRMMGRNFYDNNAISMIPPTVFVASKNGSVNASRSETILVMAPHGPYIFSIITKNQKDESWNRSNEGWVMARKLSALLWKHFEPKSKWQPPSIN